MGYRVGRVGRGMLVRSRGRCCGLFFGSRRVGLGVVVMLTLWKSIKGVGNEKGVFLGEFLR